MSFELPSPHTYPLLLSPPPSFPFLIPPPLPSLTATAIATPEALAVRTLEGLVLLPELIEARHGMGDAPLVDPPWYSQLLLRGGEPGGSRRDSLLCRGDATLADHDGVALPIVAAPTSPGLTPSDKPPSPPDPLQPCCRKGPTKQV